MGEKIRMEFDHYWRWEFYQSFCPISFGLARVPWRKQRSFDICILNFEFTFIWGEDEECPNCQHDLFDYQEGEGLQCNGCGYKKKQEVLK